MMSDLLDLIDGELQNIAKAPVVASLVCHETQTVSNNPVVQTCVTPESLFEYQLDRPPTIFSSPVLSHVDCPPLADENFDIAASPVKKRKYGKKMGSFIVGVWPLLSAIFKVKFSLYTYNLYVKSIT
jgi:hypothetical protein